MTANFCNCQQIIFLEKVSEIKPSVGYFLLRNSLDRYGMFGRSFLRRKHLLILILRNNISWFVYILCLHQSEEDLWEVLLKAPRAYKCKQILGLCHSPPQIEKQCGLWKTLFEVKNISSRNMSVMMNVHDWSKALVLCRRRRNPVKITFMTVKSSVLS